MNLPAKHRRPSAFLSTGVVLLLALVWGYLRLYLFREIVFPLTYVLPLMVCVWTGRRWQLWSMAGVFSAMAIVKATWLLPDQPPDPNEPMTYFVGTLLNILIGSLVVHWIIALREGLENRNATMAAQNQELEAQAEELASQNEEIKAQAEELASQNEEIESQAEEAARQNEELSVANQRLERREDILQNLLQSSRAPGLGPESLKDLCERALTIVGAPAQAVALLEMKGDLLNVKAQIGFPAESPEQWPVKGSIAEIVCETGRTAYVSDLLERRDLASPFGEAPAFRSLLATPLRFADQTTGMVVAASAEAGHWSDEQFRVLEWLAAQFGLLLEALRWQEAVVDRAQELESANQAKDRFLAMLSHELRTPLTPVLAAASALENDPNLPDTIRNDIRMIRRNVRIQSRLIDDLLDLTRIERGKIDLDRQHLNISALLQDAATIVGPDLDAKDQTLALELIGLDYHLVDGDGPRLQQVFWNLLKNASKFSPAGTPIAMQAEVLGTGSRVRIAVHDQGVGIHPDNAERIFAPFEQIAKGPGRSTDAGLGLGLAIAKAIVELHKGAISLHSKGEGQGASFFVELPLVHHAEPEAITAGPSASTPEVERKKKLHILLVEDHADTGLMLSRLLAAIGYKVDHAANAAEAWHLFQEHDYDLVISDLGLPDESGLDLMRRLRRKRPDIPGVCLSGFGMEEDKNASAEAGFGEHVTKPVELPRLEAAIVRLLTK